MSDQQGGSRGGPESAGAHAHGIGHTNPTTSAPWLCDSATVSVPLPPRYREAMLAAPSDTLIGTIIDGRYRVESVLGEGGMGVVFRCRHQIIDKLVAMKVLRADLARDEEATTRFLNEARTASAIGNPHIVDISDFGRLPDGSTYFIMEYLDGKPLSAITAQRQPVPVKRILQIALELAEGLAAAHRSGIVHRDLKPDNIFLISRGSERNFVKILDFGIAKVSTAGQTSKLTRAGAIFGTPHYMSPEQAAGAPVDARVDIYALGVILYELASGRVPFDADNFMGILTQHMYKAPVPIRALVPAPQEVPPGLEAIVLKCLSKRPEHRYASMEELIDELLKVQEGIVPDAVSDLVHRSQGFSIFGEYTDSGMPAPVPATPERGRSRWPLYAGLAGVGAAVLLVVAVFALSSPIVAAPTPPVDPPTEFAPPPTPPPAPAPDPVSPVLDRSGPAEANPPHTVGVVVLVKPEDARIFSGDDDLGTNLALIPVQEGRPLVVEIRRAGYEPKTEVLDGTRTTVSVRLERTGRARADQQSGQSNATVGQVAGPRTTQAPQTGQPREAAQSAQNPQTGLTDQMKETDQTGPTQQTAQTTEASKTTQTTSTNSASTDEGNGELVNPW